MQTLLQILVDGVSLGAVFALVAVGLTLIFGVGDVVNFAHGAFLMMGMYICYFAWKFAGVDPLMALPGAAAAIGLLGVASYLAFVRHAMRGPMVAQIFVTFGLLVFLQGVAQAAFSPNFRSIENSVLLRLHLQVGGIAIPGPQLAALVGSVLATGFTGLFVRRTKIGRALQATAEDRVAAAMVGIDTNRMLALSWLIGGALVGVAAALVAAYQPIYPTAGLAFGLAAFMIVALGGFGSVWGALVAAYLAGLVESLGGYYVSPTYKEVWLFILFLAVLLVRPQGLFGRR